MDIAIQTLDTIDDQRCEIHNQRVIDVVIKEENRLESRELTRNMEPIVGYAKEALVSLRESCFPLVEHVYDILSYADEALNKTSLVPADGLTRDESASIRLYTMEWIGPHRSLYSMLNRTLKNGDRQDLKPYFKYLKLFVTGLVKIPCTPSSTVWRGVTKNASADFESGTRVTWWAFSSCTTALTVLENNMYLGNSGNRTLFSVEAINGRIIRNHSQFDNEDEILLLPGTHMVVQSKFSPAPELHVIHLKQLRPQQILLESPFEGAQLYPKLKFVVKFIFIVLKLKKKYLNS